MSRTYVECENCPHRTIDGGPGPVMVCGHPRQTHGHYGMGVISWEGDNWENRKRMALAKECPLHEDYEEANE